MAQMAIKDGVSLIQTVPGLPPRCAVGFLALPVAVVLSKIFAVRTDFQELSDTLTTISESCALETDRKHNPAKKLALELRGKTPHFYGTRGLTEVVARRAKTQLNENVKRFASWGIFPEVCHNEIVPWSGDGSIDLSGFQPVFVRDKAEPRRIQQRIDITQHLLAEEGQGYSQIWTRGKEALTRVFSGIYIADWMSYYLAVLEGTDPTPVRFIDRLKDELKKTI